MLMMMLRCLLRHEWPFSPSHCECVDNSPSHCVTFVSVLIIMLQLTRGGRPNSKPQISLLCQLRIDKTNTKIQIKTQIRKVAGQTVSRRFPCQLCIDKTNTHITGVSIGQKHQNTNLNIPQLLYRCLGSSLRWWF